MRLFRWALIAILIVVFGVAVQQTFLWLGIGGGLGESQVKALDDGDQEVALIEPATSTDDWGRLVTAIELIERDWHKVNPTLPALKVSLANAFPPLTVEVPEIVFTFADEPAQLRLRWYKISGEHDALSWVRKLHARARPPLAIIGGGTSDRAITLAYALKNTYADPERPAPVFLITTATAEETKSRKSLIDVYKDRTFRFSFTNQKMVEALLQFVQHRQFPDDARKWGAQSLWAHQPTNGSGLTDAALGMMASMPGMQRYITHAVYWQDERYSQDMFSLFRKEFGVRFPLGQFNVAGSIASGVGGFFHPAPEEQFTVDTFLAGTTVTPNSFLVLPTQTVRMRRFLINLRQRSPQDARNLVVLNGDALSFHTVYRDRDVLWNILDLPYSVVFFAHRNPVQRSAGFVGPNDKSAANGDPPGGPSGTHDILLYRDLFDALLYAVHDGKTLLDDSGVVRARLRATCWYDAPGRDPPRVCNPDLHPLDATHRRLFDAEGERQSRTGEHIVWVKPKFTDERVDLVSTISIWNVQRDRKAAVWRLADSFPVAYNQSRLEGSQP